jgi:hypothetical protein
MPNPPAKSSSGSVPPIATLKRALVAFYIIPDKGLDSVETPVVGNPAVEYAALENAILRKHPEFKPGQLRRQGSVVELRDANNTGFIEYGPGATIRQIFEGLTVGQEPVRNIGRVFYEGSPYFIALHYTAGGQIKIVLQPRLGSDSAIRLPDVIAGQRVIAELPAIITELLGNSARDITFQLREVKNQVATTPTVKTA